MTSRGSKPVGKVVPGILRRAVEPTDTAKVGTNEGIPLFPVARNARVVTPEIVRELLEDEPWNHSCQT